MDTHAHKHANGHNGSHLVKSAKKAGKKASKKGSAIARQVGTKLEGYKAELGDIDVKAEVGRLARWVSKNPKTAVGVGVGLGLLVGAIGNGKFGRAALIGIAGMIGKRFI